MNQYRNFTENLRDCPRQKEKQLKHHFRRFCEFSSFRAWSPGDDAECDLVGLEGEVGTTLATTWAKLFEK